MLYNMIYKIIINFIIYFWRMPKLLDKLNFESKGENNERRKNWGMLPSSQHFGGLKGVLELQDGD